MTKMVLKSCYEVDSKLDKIGFKFEKNNFKFSPNLNGE